MSAKDGMARAVKSADEKHMGWSSQAHSLLVLFLKGKRGTFRFQSDDVMAFAHSQGLPVLPDSRAWGAIFAAAARQGLIVKHGYSAIKRPSAHHRPATVWGRG